MIESIGPSAATMTSSTSPLYALLDAARLALESQDSQTALRLTAAVLQHDPDHLEARHLAGLAAYCGLGGPGAAVVPSGVFCAFNSQCGTMHQQVALILQRCGQHELALAAFRTAALLDFHLQPGLRAGFGGPFNGQVLRVAAFRAIARFDGLTEVIETGAYRGTTTEFMAQHVACPVKTTESHPYFHEATRLRFEDLARRDARWATAVQLNALDSRAFLIECLREARSDGELSFFYLDAHGDYISGQTVENPFVEEVRLIRRARRGCIVMIDDFEVPDDPTYGVDDGNTMVNLAPLLPEFDAWFSPLEARHDTGSYRGSIVLSGSPETTVLLSGIPELRHAGGR
jgi:hypothetical protein